MTEITINGRTIQAANGATVLEAARANGIYVPTLCAMEGLKPKAACRLCSVMVNGGEKLACTTKIHAGMEIVTDSPELFEKRKAIVTEMLRQHRVDCHHCLRIGSTKAKDFDPAFCKDCFFCDCVRDGFCELQAKALEFGIDVLPFEIRENDFPIDDSTGSIIRDPNKCIKCRRCTEVCQVQGVGILGMVKTENGQTVGAKTSLMADGCIRCGRCVSVCPTGALFLKEHKDEEIYFAHQYGTKTAALVCSCVLGELEELFGAPKGSFRLEQLVDGLRKLGIDEVFDPAAVRHIAMNRAADRLDERLGKGCVILAQDYAAKNYLTAHFADLADSFLFYDSPQQVFSEILRARSPEAKLYHINTRHSFGAEAQETGNIDYFINARELYRIFLRTGVHPAKRPGLAADKLCEFDRCTRFRELLRAGEWSVSGKAQELHFAHNGREYLALICNNLSQVRKAVKNMDTYDVIKVIG